VLPTVPIAVRWVLQAVAATAFVVAVYEAVVAGVLAVWPDATDNWILLMWMIAASVAGAGLNPVRRAVGAVLGRLWPATLTPTSPLAALAAPTEASDAADAPDAAAGSLAALVAAGTGADTVGAWIADEGGLRRVGRWTRRGGADGSAGADAGQAADLAALADLPGVDHVEAVADGAGLVGALTLTTRRRRGLTPYERRLVLDAANAAALLLRSIRLTAQLRVALEREGAQAAGLARSRMRVALARDAARELLSREIQLRVGAPLRQCADDLDAILEERGATPPGPALPAMTDRVDTAIKDFRDIVHGFYPAALDDHGLTAALESLVADVPLRADFRSLPLPRFDRRIETSVYFCVAAAVGAVRTAAALDDTATGQLRLDTVRSDPARSDPAHEDAVLALTLQVETATPLVVEPEVVESIRDRIEALRGTLDITGTGSRTTVAMEIPLSDDNDRATPR
jgi:signal transduction histidine kinase